MEYHREPSHEIDLSGSRPSNQNWDSGQERVEATSRRLKKFQNMPTGGVENPYRHQAGSDGRVKCPHCKRRFHPDVAETHIPKCKSVFNKPKTLRRKSLPSIVIDQTTKQAVHGANLNHHEPLTSPKNAPMNTRRQPRGIQNVQERMSSTERKIGSRIRRRSFAVNNEVYSHSHDHHYPHDPMNPHNPNHPHPALLDPSVMKNLEEDEDGDMEDQQQQQQQQQDEGEDANYIRERMRRAMQNDPFLNQTQQQPTSTNSSSTNTPRERRNKRRGQLRNEPQDNRVDSSPMLSPPSSQFDSPQMEELTPGRSNSFKRPNSVLGEEDFTAGKHSLDVGDGVDLSGGAVFNPNTYQPPPPSYHHHQEPYQEPPQQSYHSPPTYNQSHQHPQQQQQREQVVYQPPIQQQQQQSYQQQSQFDYHQPPQTYQQPQHLQHQEIGYQQQQQQQPYQGGNSRPPEPPRNLSYEQQHPSNYTRAQQDPYYMTNPPSEQIGEDVGVASFSSKLQAPPNSEPRQPYKKPGISLTPETSTSPTKLITLGGDGGIFHNSSRDYLAPSPSSYQQQEMHPEQQQQQQYFPPENDSHPLPTYESQYQEEVTYEQNQPHLQYNPDEMTTHNNQQQYQQQQPAPVVMRSTGRRKKKGAYSSGRRSYDPAQQQKQAPEPSQQQQQEERTQPSRTGRRRAPKPTIG